MTSGPPLHPTAYVSSFVINLLALALPLVILQVYDRILPNQSRETLAYLILGLTGVILVDTIMKIARSYLVGWAATRDDYQRRCDAVKRVLYAPKSRLADAAPSSILDRLNALDTIRDFYGGSTRLLLLDLPFILVFLALIGLVGGYLFAVPLVLFAVLGVATIISGNALRDVHEKRMEHDDRRHDFAIEILQGISTIKSMAMEPQIQRRFERLQRNSADTNYQTIVLGNMSQTFGNTFANISMIFMVSIGALLVIDGRLTVGALACCTLLSGRTIQPLLRAIGLWSQLQSITLAREHVAELFELPVPDDQELAPVSTGPGDISIRNLSFGRPGQPELLLENVNLEIPAGTTIGIRGNDGDGKSTLMNLISGDAKPLSGDVLIDGVSTSGPAHRALGEYIAYVAQKSYIVQGTILENITMFRTGEAVDKARIAAQLIGLEENIHRLPEGYDTPLGASITNELPGGMIQSVAIARALARSPKILLFDEANSSLDAQSDQKLREGLEQLKGHMTIILVSNRPSLLKLADRVYQCGGGGLTPVDLAETSPAASTIETSPQQPAFTHAVGG